MHVERYNTSTRPGQLRTPIRESVIVSRIRHAMQAGALPARYGAAFVPRDLPRGEGVGVYALTIRHTVDPFREWSGTAAPVTESIEWCLVTTRLLASLEDVPVRLMGTAAYALVRAPHPAPSDPDQCVVELVITVLVAPPTGGPPKDPGAVAILHTRYPTPRGVLGTDWDAEGDSSADVPLVWTAARAPHGWP